MGKIWVTSDTHFCHQREFLWGPRGFSSSEEADAAIIKNWNSVVGPEDDVYLLGDIMLNDNLGGLKCLRQLNGYIHIVCGNHDSNERIKLYEACWNVVEVKMGIVLKYGNYRFFLTHYPTLCGNYDDGKELKKHVINLCGHTHTKDPFIDWDKGLIYHVELDAHNNYPVLIDDAIEDIRKKFQSM